MKNTTLKTSPQARVLYKKNIFPKTTFPTSPFYSWPHS
ncbi:unnamed protein product, partial [Vitis vinifera]|uniref:Uncharacterized protein n=1 Tax=Vitis vinifera TaxID=29760 RepID=D7UB96_VITVI